MFKGSYSKLVCGGTKSKSVTVFYVFEEVLALDAPTPDDNPRRRVEGVDRLSQNQQARLLLGGGRLPSRSNNRL